MSLIEPRWLKGLRDYLAEAMMPREALIATAQAVYGSFGYSPIDTPALEYFDVLSGKGSDETDRQMYAFDDHGGRRVGMRFDLTVPLARFAAQHANELGLPFRRYHIGTVWRGENTQAGRYREFMQCDFDTIGTTSNAADVESALVIHDLLVALGFERFEVRINNRLVLNCLLDQLALRDRAAAWTTTPARSTRRSCSTRPASAASAPAAGTTTSPGCSPSRRCRASGRRSAWTGSWRRWKTSASYRR